MSYYTILKDDCKIADIELKPYSVVTIPNEQFPQNAIPCVQKSIFAYLDKGTHIAEVEIPKDAQVIKQKDSFNVTKLLTNKVKVKNIARINSDLIKTLIKKGASVRVRYSFVLFWAIWQNNINLVKFILKHGADVRADSDYAVRLAAYNNNFKMVQILLKYGASKNAALHIAATRGHEFLVQFLLKQNADVHYNNDVALTAALFFGHTSVIKLLLEHKANVLKAAGYFSYIISTTNNIKLIKLLIDAGVPIPKDALFEAYKQKNVEMVKLLLNYKVNYIKCDAVLYWAAASNHIDIVKKLLTITPGFEIKPAYEIASAYGHKDIENYLSKFLDKYTGI